MRVVALAAALVAVSAASDAAAAPPCSATAAKGAIRATKLKMQLLGPDRVRISPNAVSRVVCADFTRDGVVDMAVTIASGGTAGDIGWVVFVTSGPGRRVARTGSGYKLGLFRVGGDLDVVQPVYKKTDPNCCPTGGFDHTRYHWDGTRFVVARAYRTKTFRP